jgi:two-component system, cell cycle sensor histidine kinase and response regulator CckA
VVKAAETASQLTRQLLAFARKQPIAPAVVDPNAVVSNLRGMLARLLGEDVELRLALADPLDTVLIDRGQLEQVLLNLAVNARDAMAKGGVLEIATANEELDEAARARLRLARAGKHVAIAVRDDGCGMSDDVRRRVFEPFFTTKEPGKGTGLGLSTVYGAVQQAGGAIEIESRVGEGTEFRIHLPSHGGPAEPAEAGAAESGSPRGQAVILVAEDEEAVRDLEVMALERFGYRVLAARDGREALEIAAAYEGRLDLLLTDIVMPVMDGRELAERLARARPGLRILFMSGYPNEIDLGESSGRGPRAFIQKPHTPRELAEKVKEILSRG